jgi:hypothetical protein
MDHPFGSKKALHSGLSRSDKIINNPFDSLVSDAFVYVASSGSLTPANVQPDPKR